MWHTSFLSVTLNGQLFQMLASDTRALGRLLNAVAVMVRLERYEKQWVCDISSVLSALKIVLSKKKKPPAPPFSDVGIVNVS